MVPTGPLIGPDVLSQSLLGVSVADRRSKLEQIDLMGIQLTIGWQQDFSKFCESPWILLISENLSNN